MAFSVRHTLREGFDTWKQYWGIATLFFLTFVLISGIVPNLIEWALRTGVAKEHIEHPLVAFLFAGLIPIVNLLFTTYASMGMVNVNLKMSAREPVQWKDFFSANSFFTRFLGGSLLTTLIFFIISFVLSITILLLSTWAIGEKDVDASRIPIIFPILAIALFVLLFTYLFVLIFQWPYYLIDQSTPLLDSFQKSIKSSKGHRIRLLVLTFILTLFILLGGLCLIVGLLFTAPLAGLTWAHAYRALKNPVQ